MVGSLRCRHQVDAKRLIIDARWQNQPDFACNVSERQEDAVRNSNHEDQHNAATLIKLLHWANFGKV